MHGLSIESYNKIKSVLDKYPNCELRLFGSRAKGTYKYNSDIDLAVINEASTEVTDKIRRELNDLDIIYKIDLVVVRECNNDRLIENIMKEGVEF